MKHAVNKIRKTAKLVRSKSKARKAVPQIRMTDREEADKIASLM